MYCFFTRNRHNKCDICATTITVPVTQQGDNFVAAEPVLDRYQKTPPFRKARGIETAVQVDNVNSTPLTSTEPQYEPVVASSLPRTSPSPSPSPLQDEHVYESSEVTGSSYMPMSLPISVPSVSEYDIPRSQPGVTQVGEAVHYVNTSRDGLSSDTSN